MTATRITATGAGAYNRQQLTVPPSTAYTLQRTAKKVSGDWLEFGLSDYVSNAFNGWCNLATGATGSTQSVGSAVATSIAITSLGGGWYTCTLKGTSGTNGGLYYMDNRTVNADLSVTATTGQAIDIWHPQATQGSTAYAWGEAIARKSYAYFGFIGDPANRFRMAQSNDLITWNGYAGVWETPAQINAPQVMTWHNQYLLHVAKASDQALSEYVWYIGQVDGAGTVTTIATINWAGNLPGLYSCFSGGPILLSGVWHIIVPCSLNDRYHSLAYETHMVGDDPTQWSAPVLITTNGIGTGSYDYKPFLIGSTYYMWSTRVEAGSIDISTATTLLGPYTAATPASVTAFGIDIEGPTMVSTGATSWRISFEQLLSGTPKHKMWYSDCNTLDPTACTWTARTAWSEDLLYRHGSIIATPTLTGLFPLPNAFRRQ